MVGEDCPKAICAVPASGKRSAACAGLATTSTPGTCTMVRQKPRLADSIEEPRTPVAEQHENDEGTSVRGSTEDVVFHDDYPRVRDGEVTLAGTAATSSSEYDVTSGYMSAQPPPEEAAAAAVLIPTEPSLLQPVEQMFLGDAGGPVASRSVEAPVQVTNGLVLVASDAVSSAGHTDIQQCTSKRDRSDRIRPSCVHGVIDNGYACKLCLGRGICEHQRRKSSCKACRAARGLAPCVKARCACGLIKDRCQKCGGSQLCEHGHQRYACRKGLCPERRLAAAAGRGYYSEEEVISALTLAPPRGLRLRSRGGELVRWPMGFPTGKRAIEHAMRVRSSVLVKDWPYE